MSDIVTKLAPSLDIGPSDRLRCGVVLQCCTHGMQTTSVQCGALWLVCCSKKTYPDLCPSDTSSIQGSDSMAVVLHICLSEASCVLQTLHHPRFTPKGHVATLLPRVVRPERARLRTLAPSTSAACSIGLSCQG